MHSLPSLERISDYSGQMSTGNQSEPNSGADPFHGPGKHPVPTDVRMPKSIDATEETSAGGLLVDRSGPTLRAALIGKLDRRGRLMWSMPKGHIEPGETREDAAIREVMEETGLTGRIVDELGSVDYWFVSGGRRIHKTVHHFLMERTGGEISTDDAEVEAVELVPLSELPERLVYADERGLFSRALELLDHPQ